MNMIYPSVAFPLNSHNFSISLRFRPFINILGSCKILPSGFTFFIIPRFAKRFTTWIWLVFNINIAWHKFLTVGRMYTFLNNRDMSWTIESKSDCSQIFKETKLSKEYSVSQSFNMSILSIKFSRFSEPHSLIFLTISSVFGTFAFIIDLKHIFKEMGLWTSYSNGQLIYVKVTTKITYLHYKRKK